MTFCASSRSPLYRFYGVFAASPGYAVGKTACRCNKIENQNAKIKNSGQLSETNCQ
jgi:hypothetical protein